MKITIAIDGHAGCGKSTTAKQVAKELNYVYIDSGAMYRAVTYFFIQKGVKWDNLDEVKNALKNIKIEFKKEKDGKQFTILNGRNIEKKIRTYQISDKVSDVSTIKAVRKFLVAQQQELGKKKGIVMDGRDIGTVVFPDAELKVFMTADMEERALRRQKELRDKGESISLEAILENLRSRDYIDSTRKEGPLKKAKDAIVINTTKLTIKDQSKKVVKLAKKRLK